MSRAGARVDVVCSFCSCPIFPPAAYIARSFLLVSNFDILLHKSVLQQQIWTGAPFSMMNLQPSWTLFLNYIPWWNFFTAEHDSGWEQPLIVKFPCVALLPVFSMQCVSRLHCIEHCWKFKTISIISGLFSEQCSLTSVGILGSMRHPVWACCSVKHVSGKTAGKTENPTMRSRRRSIAKKKGELLH